MDRAFGRPLAYLCSVCVIINLIHHNVQKSYMGFVILSVLVINTLSFIVVSHEKDDVDFTDDDRHDNFNSIRKRIHNRIKGVYRDIVTEGNNIDDDGNNSIGSQSNRTIVHQSESLVVHLWYVVVVAVYIIAFSYAHYVVFEDVALNFESHGLSVSTLYLSIVLLLNRVSTKYNVTSIVHVMFLFCPIRRNWYLSMTAFSLYLSVFILIVYPRIHPSTVTKTRHRTRPFFQTLAYLNVHNYLLVIGVLQLAHEYYFGDFYLSFDAELDNTEEIEQMIKKDRSNVLTKPEVLVELDE